MTVNPASTKRNRMQETVVEVKVRQLIEEVETE